MLRAVAKLVVITHIDGIMSDAGYLLDHFEIKYPDRLSKNS